MTKRIGWAIAGILALSTPSYAESFEPPQFTDGQSIDQMAGWTISGSATVTAAQSAEGSQSLKIAASGTASRLLVVPGVRFIDLAILPSYGEAGLPGETLNIGGARLSFIKSGSSGQITVLSGTLAEGTPVGAPYAVEEDNLGKDWVRVTVREDTTKGTWDLFLDGEPIVFDQAVSQGTPSFQLANASGEAVYLDTFTESPENPLFKDSDGDGMPDAYEVANGLDPLVNDRDGDLDADGLSNIREMFHGSSPRIAPGGPILGSILYVDNKNGSDFHPGKVSYPLGGDGPKASIKAAMEAAQSGDTIVILPGTGTYQESTRGIEGKSLTIRPLSAITIQ